MVLGGNVTFDTSSSSTITAAQKDSLELAARLVDYHLNVDNNFTSFPETLKSSSQIAPTISGLNDHDYPGASELGVNMQGLSHLALIKRTPIPSELFEQFRLIQGSCNMGLFPEIGRAWLVIDTNIFIWSFQDGSDLAYYNGIQETIICVGLAKPKEGVFQDCIRYVLCIVTPVEVILLGVFFNQSSKDASIIEEMTLTSEPLFTFPTDNILMSTFASTENGRIFLGGQDGCLYEFTYQGQEGWFSKKCRKINHSSGFFSTVIPSFFNFGEIDSIVQLAVDNSRHILYARTEKGSIMVFDLGSDGNQMSRTCTLSYTTLWNVAANIAKTIDKKYFYPLVHINPVDANESSDVHLIAVLQSGVRLYFTTFSNSYQSRPGQLELLHLRLPPGFSANSAMDRIDRVHTTYYRRGLSLLISNKSEHCDTVYTIADDLFILHNCLIESHTKLLLDSRLWAVAEIPSKYQFKQKYKDMKEVTIDPPLLQTQHIEQPRQFIFLSNQGCSIFMKPRPVDILAKLLSENGGPISDAIKAFFKLYREIQGCVMCLILCCSGSPQDKHVAQYATQAFFHYGGMTSFIQSPMDQTLSPGETSFTQPPVAPRHAVYSSTPTQQNQGFSPEFPLTSFSSVGTPVKSVFAMSQRAMQSPMSQQQVMQPQSPISPYHSEARSFSPGSSFSPNNQSFATAQQSPISTRDALRNINAEVAFSAKHDGLYIYFSRLLRPLWNMKLVNEQMAINNKVTIYYLISNIASEDLSIFLSQLGGLKDFISKNLSYFVSNIQQSSTSMYPVRQMNLPSHQVMQEVTAIQMSSVQKSAQNEAEVHEKNSITNLYHLVSYTHELLGLWKVMCDHQFENVITFLNIEYQEQLKQIIFKDLILDVHDLAGNLASAVINFYLDDNASTIAVSQKLREVCPSIYRIEDATISQVFQIVKQTKNMLNKVERDEKLREALKLCKGVCPNFDLLNVSSLFQDVKFYDGIIDICLCTAQRSDPQNLALHYYKNGEPPSDQQGFQAYTARMKCYKTVVNVLNTLWSLRVPSNQCPSMPIYAGEESTAQAQTIMSPDEARTEYECMFENCIMRTSDELFHSAVYDWLFENGQMDTLLNISSHFLETYLKRRCNMNPESVQSFDLLWKFYEKSRNYSSAAKVLSLLADKTDSNLPLMRRIEYLSHAIICLRSAEGQVSGGSAGASQSLHELEEKMEVVRIQMQILETLQQKNIPGIQDSLDKLNSNFMDITQLFDEFANRYDLPECKLAIVYCAGHYDPSLIESFWQAIIDKELEATAGNPVESRTMVLRQKIQSLSKLYMNSEKYFPVAFIIRHLEFKTCILNFEPEWVYRTLLSVGLNLGDIWTVYHKLYRSRDSCWSLQKKPLHLLRVLSCIINEFATTPTIIPQTTRRAFVTLCLDAISAYLVDLQTMSLSDGMVSILIREFKSTQPRLERMIL